MLKPTELAPALQTLFTTTANRLARSTGFSLRDRVLTGASFAQCLVFGWLDRPLASLDDLVDLSGLNVTPQALHSRIHSEHGLTFLQALLADALSQTLSARPEAIPILRRFNGVFAEDMTDLGPLAKGLVRYNLSNGHLETFSILGPKASEVPSSIALPTLPPGSLRLADRGFFHAETLIALSLARVYWITRLPTGVWIKPDGAEKFVSLSSWLASLKGDVADVKVHACKENPIEGRLTARRCPKEVRQKREKALRNTAKRKGWKVSAAALEMCGWWVYFTNLGEEFRLEELEVLYRCRWQVELLFKRMKTLGKVDEGNGRKEKRVKVEIVAKMIGCVVAEWGALMRGGPLALTSPTKSVKKVRRRAGRIARALNDLGKLVAVLTKLERALRRSPPRHRRKKSPSTRQLLFRCKLAA